MSEDVDDAGNLIPRSRFLIAYVAVVGLEALGLLAVGIYFIVQLAIVSQIADDRTSGDVALWLPYCCVSFIGVGIMIFLGSQLWNGRPWARIATLVLAVIELFAAWSLFSPHYSSTGWALAGPGVAVIVLAFTTPVRNRFRRVREIPEDDPSPSFD